MHKHTPAVRRWREKNKALGLCICGRPRREGKTKCVACAEAHQANFRKLKFGLNRDQHQQLIDNQDNKCALCGCEIDKGSHIDHSHETGKVRGILCRRCNTSLGIYEKIILPMIDKVNNYLQNNNPSTAG